MQTFMKDTALSEHSWGAAWHVWINGTPWQGNGMGKACYVWISLLFIGHREEPETFTCSFGIQCSRMTCFIHFQYSLDPCNYFMRTWISRLVEVEVSWTHIFTYVPLKWWSSKWQGGVVICPATQLVKVLKCDRIKATAVMASRLLFTMSNKRLATFSKSGHCDVSRGGISSDDLSW